MGIPIGYQLNSNGIPMVTHGNFHGSPWGCHAHADRANALNARLGTFSAEEQMMSTVATRLFSSLSDEFKLTLLDPVSRAGAGLEQCPSFAKAGLPCNVTAQVSYPFFPFSVSLAL